MKKIIVICLLMLALYKSYGQNAGLQQQQNVSLQPGLATYEDTANYLIRNFEQQKNFYIGKPVAVLLDSLKLQPLRFSHKKFNDKTIQYYLSFALKKSVDTPCRIVVGVGNVPELDSLSYFFAPEQDTPEFKKAMDASRSQIIKDVVVAVYRKENHRVANLDRVGDIEIQKVRYNYMRDDNDVLTPVIESKKDSLIQKIYFDATGRILRNIVYDGDDEEMTIKYLTDYSYDAAKLLTKEVFYSRPACTPDIIISHENRFTYDENCRRKTDSTFYYEDDLIGFYISSGSKKTQFAYYEYLENPKQIRYIYSPDFYYKNTFDTRNRKVSQQQIAEGKVRWEWIYKYTGRKRTGTFKTYYRDSKNYTKKEWVTFNNEGQEIEIEEQNSGKYKRKTKRQLFYDKDGLLQKIIFFESNPQTGVYQVNSFIIIKLVAGYKLDKKMIRRINLCL